MISVIVPVHNTACYVQECMNSILGQTYSNLQVICVDSSTDLRTTAILQEISARDLRVRLLSDSNSSYGYKINTGIRQAKGDYIAIVDSDDYIESNMYKSLLNALLENDADFVKSDHSLFHVINGKNELIRYVDNAYSAEIYNKCLECGQQSDILYKTGISIWTGLYKKSFLQNNRIYMNESAGASFQDAGFSVLTHIYGRKIFYLHESFYRYRTDNADSSVKSQNKYRTIADEWEYIESQVKERGILDENMTEALRIRKLINYEWNLERLDEEAAEKFAVSVHGELEEQYLITGYISKMPVQFQEMFRKVYERGRAKIIMKQQETIRKELEENLFLGLISWIDFDGLENVLLLGKAWRYDRFLAKKRCKVCKASVKDIYTDDFSRNYKGFFDYIIAIEILETEASPERLLNAVGKLLKANGRFYLGTDNRMGLRYLCGEIDPFTKKRFEALNNYDAYMRGWQGKPLPAKCYTKAELKNFLADSGFHIKFYSVFPTLENPQLIIAEDYRSAERISGRYIPMYRNPDSILFYEEPICDDFAQNDALHIVANAFWIECTLNASFVNVNQVTLSIERGRENAYATILQPCGVEKRAVFEEGRENLNKIADNMNSLQKHGIAVVQGKVEGGAYVMPYVDAILGDIYLRNLLRTNLAEFLQSMDHFRELIMQSSEHVCENERGIILDNGYVDLVPLNSFYQNGEFVFFDQEFCIPNYPANAILYRAILIVYERVPEDEVLISKDMLLERYGIKYQCEWLHQITTEFIYQIRRKDELAEYYNAHMRNEKVLDFNRHQLDNMDFCEEYQYSNCFEGLCGKKVFLFGAGKWCDKFLAFYKDEYDICQILDNDENKWGTKIHEISVASPSKLLEEEGDYKVIICMRDYRPIFRQLRMMGIRNIGVYDANYFYPGRQQLMFSLENGKNKKYRIGYLSGTFDLFHIGHVNILRRAKEQCEYLIAAVTSDEYVRNRKNKEPMIPFEERLAVIKACRYVDEAVGVPVHYAGTIEAFQKYHFDCQFCGSDCEHNEWWQEQKKFLQAQGSDLVFLPYTEQTSSTKIRTLIERGLL